MPPPLVEGTSISIHELHHLSSIFPFEIIFEILLRLPVKSLLRFRCVSKSWNFLLYSSRFVKTHLDFSINGRTITNLRLALISSISRIGRICSVYSVSCEKSCLNVAKLDSPPTAPIKSAKILGSCNGLICLTTASSSLMMLWNPSTGKSKEFPNELVHGAVGCYIRYGFGYDASVDDYNVVKIISFPRNEGNHENVVKVYSSRHNSWAMIQGFNSGYINGMLGVFVNGALHWEVCHKHGSSALWEIVSLDLAAKTYGKIALPSYEQQHGSSSSSTTTFHWTLGVSSSSGSCLVACCKHQPNKTTDVWVMKEYGVEQSWTKLVSIASPVDRWGGMSPLVVSEKGVEVLLKLGRDIALYNLRDESFKQLDNYASGCCLEVQAAIYIESLASPHAS